jgi:archaellin
MLAEFIKKQGITRMVLSIMLVALVIEAGVISYDTFSSHQDGQISVYGEANGNGTLQLRGAVIAKSDPTQTFVNEVIFTVALADGAEPVNFTMTEDSNANGLLNDEASPIHTVVISYFDANQRIDDLTWKAEQYGPGNGDALLEQGESFRITVGADKNGQSGLFGNIPNPCLGKATAFTVNVKTPNGALLSIERATPDLLSTVMNLN